MGSLTSELQTVHDGQYVVRALVQVGGLLLATGMAAGSDIEQAEDRARIRALELLALDPLPASVPQPLQPVVPSPQPIRPDFPPRPDLPVRPGIAADPPPADPLPTDPLPNQSLSDRLAAVGLSLDTSAGTAKLTQIAMPTEAIPPAPSAAEPLLEAMVPPLPASTLSTPAVATQEPVVADWYSHINIEDDESSATKPIAGLSDYAPPLTADSPSPAADPVSLETVSTSPSSGEPELQDVASGTANPSVKPPPSGKPRLKNESKSDPEPAAREFVDLSDVIAQTDVELARLGWNRTQGREYLKRAYGKRSRQELDEAELYDFLHHLESQPSPQ